MTGKLGETETLLSFAISYHRQSLEKKHTYLIIIYIHTQDIVRFNHQKWGFDVHVYIYTLRICIYIIIYKSFSQQKCWLMGYHRNIMGILANCNCSSTHSWIWLRMKDTHRPPQKKTMFEGYLRLTMDKIFRMISVMSGYSCSALKIRTPEWSDGILGTSWNHVRYVKDLKWH